MTDEHATRKKAALQSQAQTKQAQTPHVPLSKPISQGQLLLEMIAISGEYPADNIHRLIPSRSYARKVISTLLGDKLIKLVNKGGVKGYRLELKGKKKNIGQIAKSRKGKIRMKLWFDNEEEHDVYISHTRAILPSNNREYTIVIVYGLSETNPMILLTNQKINGKEDVISVVRHYFYRWRVEEYFKVKKQEFGFENMRVRTLKSMNNLNMFMTFVLAKIGMLADRINDRLLSIKIKERSNSLQNKVYFWHYQMARGIHNILIHAKTGVREFQSIEVRLRIFEIEDDVIIYEQMQLDF